MNQRKAVVLLSGGMDSATTSYLAKREGHSLLALHVNYGQRTEGKEGRCARIIAKLLEAEEYLDVDISYLRTLGRSSLTDATIEIEDYDPAREHLPNTYVPFRNANLLSIATSYAEARGANTIFIGAQSLDYSGYPDCRPAFIEAFQQVIHLGTRDTTDITLRAPFLHMTKTDIVRLGMELGVPYEYTWSCYRNEAPACGQCGSCHFRLEAFRNAGVRDPIEYREI